MADALVIASVGGTYLFERAQKEYMRRAPRPYMKIVSAIMSRNLSGGPLPQANLCSCHAALCHAHEQLTEPTCPRERDTNRECPHCMVYVSCHQPAPIVHACPWHLWSCAPMHLPTAEENNTS